jgi:hypothetical protein
VAQLAAQGTELPEYVRREFEVNIHFHMLFLDGVYVDDVNGSAMRFRWVKAPTSDELTQLTHTIAQRVARFLERQGLLERAAENSYVASGPGEAGPLDKQLGHSISTSKRAVNAAALAK